MEVVTRIHGDGYGPVGECIYCGAQPPDLRKEHAISKAVRGRIVLHDASCGDCAGITKKFEDHVNRGPWNDFRVVNGMHDKGRRNPSTVRELLVRDADGTERRVALPPEHHPGVAIFLKLKEPRLFTGDTGPDVHEGFQGISTRQVLAEHIGGAERVYGRLTIDALLYAKMLAKMAHAIAVWRLGLDGFWPLLCPVIRGQTDDEDTFDYVGGEPGVAPPNEGNDHRWSTELFTHPRAGNVVVVRLRLFGSLMCDDGFGPPTYVVIVGRPTDVTQSRFEAGHFYPVVRRPRTGKGRVRPRP